MKQVWWALIILASATLVFFGGCSYLVGSVSQGASGDLDSFTSEPFVGLVRIEGEIIDALPITTQIDALKQNAQFRGLLVRIDSPGGAVAASQEIYSALEKLKKDKIPVVVSFGNVAASGGFYAAMPAEKIFTNAGTLTGSIGVIMQFPEIKDLMDKVGVQMNTVKSGQYKDVGNPFRKVNGEELAYMNSVIQDVYGQFFQAIKKYRPISTDSLKMVADGRVFSGARAVQLKLADSVATFAEAEAWIRKRSGVSADVELQEKLPPKPFLEQLMSEEMSSSIKKVSSSIPHSGLFYKLGF